MHKRNNIENCLYSLRKCFEIITLLHYVGTSQDEQSKFGCSVPELFRALCFGGVSSQFIYIINVFSSPFVSIHVVTLGKYQDFIGNFLD
jgi:hypothetical protein